MSCLSICSSIHGFHLQLEVVAGGVVSDRPPSLPAIFARVDILDELELLAALAHPATSVPLGSIRTELGFLGMAEWSDLVNSHRVHDHDLAGLARLGADRGRDPPLLPARRWDRDGRGRARVRHAALVGERRVRGPRRPSRGVPAPLLEGRPHDVRGVHVELVVPLADDLVVGLAGASVPLVVVNGVASQAVTLVVELYSAVGNVWKIKGDRDQRSDYPKHPHSVLKLRRFSQGR